MSTTSISYNLFQALGLHFILENTTTSQPIPTMAPPTAHPLWYRIFSTTANAADLTATVLRYAADYASAAIAQWVKDEEGREKEVLQFDPGASGQREHDLLHDDDSVGSDASFTAHLTSCAHRITS